MKIIKIKSLYEKKIQLLDLLNSLERETEIKKKIEENLNKKYDEPNNLILSSGFVSSIPLTTFIIPFTSSNPFGGF